MQDPYFEDFVEGQTATFGDYLITEQEIIAFASEFDPQVFHLDAEQARQTLLGGLAASGWHTASVGMRLICEGLFRGGASMGAPGVDQIRWLKPVRPGDRLHMRSRVDKTRPSRSRPEIGIVSFAFEMVNQAGQVVMTQSNAAMFRRRDAGLMPLGGLAP